MGFLELLLIGVGLSMDAFAVAVCQGLCMPKLNLRYAAVIALFFGGFQALMPYAGWLLGAQFAGYIQHLDHWLAFFLLAFIGGKMVWESLKGEAEETACAVSVTLDYKQLLLMAVATSIDALAVGVTFAFLNVDILPAAGHRRHAALLLRRRQFGADAVHLRRTGALGLQSQHQKPVRLTGSRSFTDEAFCFVRFLLRYDPFRHHLQQKRNIFSDIFVAKASVLC